MEELIHFQIDRERAVAGVNPKHSKVWKQLPLKAVFDWPDMSESWLNMGTARSDDLPGRLEICIKGTPEVCDGASTFGTHKWCPESGELEAVEHRGSITEKTMGVYTHEFCVCLIRGSEDYLNHDYSLTRRLHNAFPVGVPSDEDIEEMEPPPQSKASS